MIKVLSSSAINWSAHAFAFFSAEDLTSSASRSVVFALARASLSVEVVFLTVNWRAGLWGALASSVHLVPVVSIWAFVVRSSVHTFAFIEAPVESWLAS